MLNAHDPEAAKRLLAWWNGLEHDKGTRARLRRCRRPHEAIISVPGFHALLRSLGEFGDLNFRDRLGLAAWAIVSAHVKEHRKAERLGGSLQRGDLAESRFLRLIDSGDLDRFCAELRGCLAATRQMANVVDLADVLLRWPGERVKERLAVDFWQAATPDSHSPAAAEAAE